MPQPEVVSHTSLLFNLLQILITAVIVPGTFLLVHRLSQIRDHLATLNGRMAKAETRIEQHETIDRERLDARQAQAAECRASFRRELDTVWHRLKERGDE
jgi:hypothetical protein